MDLHLNDFATVAEYNTFMSGDYLRPNVSYIEEIGGVKYQKDAPQPHYDEEYLTFEVLEGGTFKFIDYNASNILSYSTDGGTTWTALPNDTDTPLIPTGSKIMWKGQITLAGESGSGMFSSTAVFNIEGNIMSLIYGDNFIGQTDLTGKDYCFYNMFDEVEGLVNAQNLILPATTLASHCYENMFANCTGLTTAPALPATTLATNCYCYMFYGCTSLTTAPVLPATTLVQGCYDTMFNTCNSLNEITCLATVLAEDCFYAWVEDVSPTGTFTKAAGVSIETGNDGIPEGWTVVEV